MKQLTKLQVETILKNAPVGVDKSKILDGLILKGYDLEGVDSNVVRQSLQTEPTIEQKPSIFERIKGGIEEKGAKIEQAISGEGEFAGKGAVERGISATATGFSALSSTAYNAMPEDVRNILDKVSGGIGKGVNYLADKISNSKLLQEAVMSGETGKLEEGLRIASNLGLISGEILGAEAAAKTGAKIDVGIVKGAEGIKTGVQKVVEPISNKIKTGLSSLKPKDYASAVENINNAYKTAFVANKVAVNKQLTKLGDIIGKSPDELVNNLAKEGIVPQVEGKLAKFDNSLKELTNRQSQIATTAQETLKPIKIPTSLDELKSGLIDDVKRTADPAELTKSLAEIERTIESYRLKYGDTLMPEHLGEIRISANAATKSFDRPIFEQDVSNSIGNIVRRRLDEIVPNEAYRNVNAEWGRLADLKNTIKIFDNTQIDVGILGSQMGRFGGAVALGGMALPISGPGGLVIAGIAATYGGDFVANFLRNRKFSKAAQDIIKQSLQKEPDVLQKLISQAGEVNATYLQKLLPAPKVGASIVSIRKPINLPAESASALEQRQIKQIQEQLAKSKSSPIIEETKGKIKPKK